MFQRIETGIASKNLSNDYLLWIRDYGEKLGLVGVVFEKDDGSIKVIAEGEEANLEEFIKEVKRRHYFPTDNFYTIWETPTHEFKNFEIRGLKED